MTQAQEERIYTWEDMEIGHDAPPISIEVTRQTIANYARSVRDTNPIYFDDEAARAAGFDGVIAPPTMLYSYAPMRRVDIMHARGFVAPEEASVNPRPTPFAGSEIHFLGLPVRPGDVITSTASFSNKWESRSGNRFASIRIVGHNQRGEKVADYLYNIIWEYSKGQKVRSGTAPEAPEPEGPKSTIMVVKGPTIGYESIQVGDLLPTLQRFVTQGTIDDYFRLNARGDAPSPTALLHVDEAFAEAGIFTGTVEGGPSSVAYMTQLLERVFSTRNVMNASLSERAIEPVRPGDTVTFTAKVLGKREETGKRLVDVELTGTNQLGQTTAAAKATVPL